MLFGLIGRNLSHSFSGTYFNDKFRKLDLPHRYKLFPLEDISQLPELISNNPELAGINVTIPFKESVIPFLNELSEEAQGVGAVNTILISKGKLKGYNTDVYGFGNSIKPFLESHHQRALILGTGGASKAVAYVFKELGIDHHFVSRERTGSKIFSYSDLNEYVLKHFRLIVNTTPVGMYPAVEDFPPIPYQYLEPSHFLYDLVYNPAETVFLKNGRERGCKVMNGVDMLHQQAEKAWKIWESGLGTEEARP